MIKTLARDSKGQPFVIIGLSGENITRLVANEPIQINLADIDLPPLHIAIIYGRTEADLVVQLTSPPMDPKI